jgi:polyhydroxyalkanoate synthesis regulator protein
MFGRGDESHHQFSDGEKAILRDLQMCYGDSQIDINFVVPLKFYQGQTISNVELRTASYQYESD